MFFAIFEFCDSHLLYPMFGDETTQDDDAQSRLDQLLNSDDNLIGDFTESMLTLLHSWNTGDPRRIPLSLLDMLGHDQGDQEFALWARGRY